LFVFAPVEYARRPGRTHTVTAPVPVGTALSGRPPDRARRADFPHRAPT
jgi:hypothetical protein